MIAIFSLLTRIKKKKPILAQENKRTQRTHALAQKQRAWKGIQDARETPVKNTNPNGHWPRNHPLRQKNCGIFGNLAFKFGNSSTVLFLPPRHAKRHSTIPRTKFNKRRMCYRGVSLETLGLICAFFYCTAYSTVFITVR